MRKYNVAIHITIAIYFALSYFTVQITYTHVSKYGIQVLCLILIKDFRVEIKYGSTCGLLQM
jgi:hypothetical protein